MIQAASALEDQAHLWIIKAFISFRIEQTSRIFILHSVTDNGRQRCLKVKMNE